MAIARSRSCWTWLAAALLMLLCAQFGAGTGGELGDAPELRAEQPVEPVDGDADDSDDDPPAIETVGGHHGLHVLTTHRHTAHGVLEQAGFPSTVERPPDATA